jgi:hypothetical protein
LTRIAKNADKTLRESHDDPAGMRVERMALATSEVDDVANQDGNADE